MKCPNCSSENLVPVQNELFCVECGYAFDSNMKKKGKKLSVASHKHTDLSVKPSLETEYDPGPVKAPDKVSSMAPKASDKDGKFFEPASNRFIHSFWFAVHAAILVGIVMGLAVGFSLYFQLTSDIILYVSAMALVVSVALITTAEAALFFGQSKQRDGRLLSDHAWWHSGREISLEIININLAVVVACTCIVAVMVAAYGGLSYIPEAFRLIALLAVNSIAIWFLLDLYVVRRLAVAGAAIGGLSVLEALQTAHAMVRLKRGGLFVVAVATFVIKAVGLAIAGGVFYLGHYAASADQSMAYLYYGAAVMTAVIIYSTINLETETGLWLGKYRHLAGTVLSNRRVKLLTGRTHKTIH